MAMEAAAMRALVARQPVSIRTSQVAAESELAAAAEADGFRSRVDETKKRAVMEAPSYEQFHQRVLATDLVPLAGKQIQGELMGGNGRPKGGGMDEPNDERDASYVAGSADSLLLDLAVSASSARELASGRPPSWAQLATESATKDEELIARGIWADGSARVGRRCIQRPKLPSSGHTVSAGRPQVIASTARRSIADICAQALRPSSGYGPAGVTLSGTTADVTPPGGAGAPAPGVTEEAIPTMSALSVRPSVVAGTAAGDIGAEPMLMGMKTTKGERKGERKGKGKGKGKSDGLPRTLMQLERDWRRCTSSGERLGLVRALGPRRLARLTAIEVDAGLLSDVLEIACDYSRMQCEGGPAAGTSSSSSTRWDREALGWVEALVCDRTPAEQSLLPWAKGYTPHLAQGAGGQQQARYPRIAGAAALAWTLCRAEAKASGQIFLERCLTSEAADVSTRGSGLASAIGLA